MTRERAQILLAFFSFHLVVNPVIFYSSPRRCTPPISGLFYSAHDRRCLFGTFRFYPQCSPPSHPAFPSRPSNACFRSHDRIILGKTFQFLPRCTAPFARIFPSPPPTPRSPFHEIPSPVSRYSSRIISFKPDASDFLSNLLTTLTCYVFFSRPYPPCHSTLANASTPLIFSFSLRSTNFSLSSIISPICSSFPGRFRAHSFLRGSRWPRAFAMTRLQHPPRMGVEKEY